MKSPTFPRRVLASTFEGIRTLGMRTLILTVLSLALLNIAILTAVTRSNPEFESSLRGPPVVRQAAAAARLMDELNDDERALALAALNSPMLRFSISEDFSRTPPVENPSPVFVPIISLYGAVLGDRPFSVYQRSGPLPRMWNRATLRDDLIIVMRLEDGSGLVVQSGEQFRRLMGFYGVALVFGVVSLVLIGLMTWASLAYAAPLGRLARASKGFVEGADTSRGLGPLPETGPKPVRDLAQALNLAGSKLVRLTVERSTTLAAIAHDLRTYLTRLRMRSEFIEEGSDRDKIVRDIESMAQLVDDTLLLGKGAARPPVLERLELAGWLKDFVAQRAEIGQPVSLGPVSGPVFVDAAKPNLDRAFNNLVDNALRYAGKATLRLVDDGGDMVSIEVLDRGPGVPESFLDQMSDPFTRLEQSRSRDTGGAGLGLAIAKALVEQIGGTLSLANRREGGFSAVARLRRAP